MAGLQRYIYSKKNSVVRLADPRNSTFRQLHQLLENRYRELHAQGVGTTQRQAESNCGKAVYFQARHL